jgi:phosphoribosylformimino-5-aminoimidazole carboxamide ribotide isomerase
MIIYPAIDLRQGRCVRLRQGDPNAETVFGDDPAAMACHWAAQGAEWLHVVNLDGALGATQAHLHQLHQQVDEQALPLNLRRLAEIRRTIAIPIQFGGGLRTAEDIRLALELGADRVILGTAAVEKPRLVAEAVERWGAERIAVGIDARDGMVAIHGWQETSRVDAVELGHQVHALGIRRVVYTDIGRDGMLSGVNVAATARLGDVTGLSVIASGGVAGIADIQALKEHEHFNIGGVIVGQALYTGNLDLPAAIALGHARMRRRSAGLVPYRMSKSGPQFLLLFNSFFEQWQFPRGGVHRGEPDLACAQREFQEESGLQVVRLHEDCRTELHYEAHIRTCEIDRTIVYYLAEIGAGDIRLSNEDHCEGRWVSAQEAWDLLTETSPEQLPALDAAVAYLSGPAARPG